MPDPSTPTPSVGLILAIQISAQYDDLVATAFLPPPLRHGLLNTHPAANPIPVCSRQDCTTQATHRVVVLLYQPHEITPYESYWNVFVCDDCMRSTYAQDVLSSQWSNIVDQFRQLNEPLPTHERSRIRFDDLRQPLPLPVPMH